MNATKDQKKRIRANFKYDVGLKEEAVQWATGDNSKTSLNDLDFDQAAKIIAAQTGKPKEKAPKSNWGAFSKGNAEHKVVLSALISLGWTTVVPKYGKVADIQEFGNWLEFGKAPVKKPLKQMNKEEVEKTIAAIKSMTRKKYK